MLFQALVLLHTDYCLVVWNDCGVGVVQRVERIQNYALGMILRKPPNYEPMPATLGWPTLETRRQIAVVMCINVRPSAFLPMRQTHKQATPAHGEKTNYTYIYDKTIVLNFKELVTIISYQVPSETYETPEAVQNLYT